MFYKFIFTWHLIRYYGFRLGELRVTWRTAVSQGLMFLFDSLMTWTLEGTYTLSISRSVTLAVVRGASRMILISSEMHQCGLSQSCFTRSHSISRFFFSSIVFVLHWCIDFDSWCCNVVSGNFDVVWGRPMTWWQQQRVQHRDIDVFYDNSLVLA